MQRVFTTSNSITIKHFKNVLEDNGISCMIKNDSLISTAGEIPHIWPEIWVHKDEQVKKAKLLIEELTELPETSIKEWICSNCNENNESQFKICWQCNQSV